jgi:hypothetical protein
MPVTTSELLLYKSTNTPSDETSLVGGAISATQITGTSVGEVYAPPITQSNSFPGADRIHYEKVFYKNTDTTSDLSAGVIFILNSIDDIGSAGVLTVASSSSSDVGTLVVIGYDNTGNPQEESIAVNGLNNVQGLINWTYVQRAIFTDGNGNPIAAVGDLSLAVAGTNVGKIPSGYHSATGEFRIGLAATLSDTATTTNTITAPGGITFTKPRSASAGIAVANSGVLTHLQSQGIWLKMTTKAGLAAASDVDVVLSINGTV